MGTVYFIGDTHFGHKKILQFSPERGDFSCIEEHDQFILDQWNSVVRKRDVVYHLGDVALASQAYTEMILEQLKGRKILIRGNHDTLDPQFYLRYFQNIHGAFRYKRDMLLTHIPVHPGEMRFRFKLNIHGHKHNSVIDDDRYFNVSCEQIGCRPISLDEVRAKWEQAMR